jgi:hypothetical protein
MRGDRFILRNNAKLALTSNLQGVYCMTNVTYDEIFGAVLNPIQLESWSFLPREDRLNLETQNKRRDKKC